jgi:hypothetical protein
MLRDDLEKTFHHSIENLALDRGEMLRIIQVAQRRSLEFFERDREHIIEHPLLLAALEDEVRETIFERLLLCTIPCHLMPPLACLESLFSRPRPPEFRFDGPKRALDPFEHSVVDHPLDEALSLPGPDGQFNGVGSILGERRQAIRNSRI